MKKPLAEGWAREVSPGSVHVLFYSSIHLCLETNSFYWHCTIFGTALSDVLSCFQTWGIIKACTVLRRLNSSLRGNKRIKHILEACLIILESSVHMSLTQLRLLSPIRLNCFVFPSFPSSLISLCWVCSSFFFCFSNKGLSEILSEMVSSPFMECNSHSSSSSPVMKQHVTN